MGGDSNSETRMIQVEEEREAEHVETTDYFFDKIGESVPLTPNNSSFDLQNPPSIPLAVSERFRLILVAHPDGFCVAKTVDVINLAKDIKSGRAAASSSVLDVSIVQVPIGRVSVLSLSTDSSTLAASVGGDIHLFSVKSLLAKEKEPHLLLSIESPHYVKYISWTKKRDTSFVSLSNTGTLYGGDLKQPLKHVMDDVDAVEWSIKGEFLAVARKQIVSILTPEFDERKQILLQFKLGLVDANEGDFIVDSIQWVRTDCIMVGCLQQTVVGKEEDYLVQVITCENGEEITDASSRPVILCLSDLFLNIVDDIMPFRHGPHLLLRYLESRQLAVVANRKNTDQHVVLVGWLDDSDGPAVIHIERDNWLPRIELQENGDDNVLLGMCIDRASVYENIQLKLGEDDPRELSPYCIFICLTHEGKLVIFHFASISGDSGAPSAVPVPSDEEEAISTTGTPDLPTISVEQKNDKIKQVVLDLQSRDMNRDQTAAAAAVDQEYFQKNREASYTDKSSNSMLDFDQTLIMGKTTGMWISTAKDQLGPSPSLADVDKVLGSGQSGPIGNEYFKQNSVKSFAADASKVDAENFNQAEKLKIKQEVLDLQSRDINRDKTAAAGVDQKYFQKDREASYTDQFSTSMPHFDQTFSMGRTTGMWTPPAKDQLGPSPLADVDKIFGSGQSGPIGNECLKQMPFKSFAADASKIDYHVGKNFPISSNLSHGEKSKNSVELGNRESRSNRPTIFRDVLEQGAANLSGSFSSSGTVAINPGRATSGPTNVTMGINSMQVQGSLLPGKAVSYVQPVNVNHKSPSQSMHSKYGNIKDMTSELDKLLQCIEEPGGFMDTCTSSQKLLENFEETMMVLCHKCTTWQNLLHEQGESIQHLLDNTVQVLARRMYMEGIVKQTRDKQYWDLWNRQKLSSELQMKRQSMINLSQDLINQLIELEKHFNALELNNYGESNAVNLGCQSFRRKYAPSRQIQSLHAVHNSLNSQLAAAEQLSDCLSRQMSVLSITSPSVKPENVKDQLFKMIGIPCDSVSEISSHAQKVINTDTPHVTPLFSSVAATIGNDFRSNQTGTNNHEPETARRRRDSFDQNWANFEPSKTTIKRRGNELSDVQRPSLLMDKRFSISSNAEGSVVSCSSEQATHLDLFQDDNCWSIKYFSVVEDASKNFFPRCSSKSSRDNKDIHELSAFSVNHSQIIDKRSLGAFSLDSSKYSGVRDLNVKKETHQVTAERHDHERTNIGNPESVLKERKIGFTVSQDQPRAQSLVSPFSKITTNMPMSYNRKDSDNTVEQKVSGSLPSGSGSCNETESSHVLSLSNQPATFAQLATPTNVAQSSEVLTTSPRTIFPSLSSSVIDSASRSLSSSSSTPTGQKFSSTIAAGALNSTTDNQGKLGSASQPTMSFSFASPSSLSSTKSVEKAAASSMASSANSRVKPVNIEHQSSGDKVNAGSTLSDASSFNPVDTLLSKSHEMSASSPMAFFINSTLKTPNTGHQPSASKVDAVIPQKELPKSKLNWNIPTIANSSNVASTALASGSHFSLSGSTNSESKKSPGVFVFPQEPVSTSEDKTADSAVGQEDEMEEEAPDTSSQAAELSFGSLGGLGLGSTGPSTNSAFRSNPFGAATVNTSASVISSTNMTVPSGQLFLPASFSFQTLQPSQQPPPANAGGFNTLAPSGTSLGQPTAQIGSGQQALGSVLGSFGQSRQLGPALQSSNHGSGGFASVGQSGGFLNAASASATGGGFAGLSAVGAGFAGGFAGAGATGGGFANLSIASGGFPAVTGGGFGGAVSGGGGFGGFSNQGGGGGGFGNQGGGVGGFGNQGGGGGFSSFGGGLGGKQPPTSQLFTQMRK